MLGDVGVKVELKQIPKGGDINAWRRGEAGDWDVLGNGYGNQTGLALTNLQGQYGGTAAKEKTRDTYHGFVFPEMTTLLDQALRRARRGQARRPAQGGAGEDLGALAGDVGLDPDNVLASASGSPPSTCRRPTPTTCRRSRSQADPMRRYVLKRVAQTRPDGLDDGDGGVRPAPAGARRPRGELRPAEPVAANSSTPIRQAVRARPAALQQYLDYLGQLARGDLGESFQFRQAALQVVLDRLPYTITLAVAPSSSPRSRDPPRGLDGPAPQHRSASSAPTSRPSPGSRCPTSGSGSCCSSSSRCNLSWFAAVRLHLDHLDRPALPDDRHPPGRAHLAARPPRDGRQPRRAVPDHRPVPRGLRAPR